MKEERKWNFSIYVYIMANSTRYSYQPGYFRTCDAVAVADDAADEHEDEKVDEDDLESSSQQRLKDYSDQEEYYCY